MTVEMAELAVELRRIGLKSELERDLACPAPIASWKMVVLLYKPVSGSERKPGCVWDCTGAGPL